MAGSPKVFYEFDSFRIDPEERILSQNGTAIPLTPKAFEILMILVQHSERVVLKDDLMKLLWPDSFVEEANLTQNIFILRKALGESGRSYRYIVTVPGRGYRFATKVAEVSGGAKEPVRSPAIENQSPSAGDNASGRRRLILGVGAFILLLVAGGLSFRMPLIHRWLKGTPPSGVAESSTIPIRRSVAVLGFQNVSGQLDEGWLSTAISEMLSTELAAGEELRMISGEDVARMKQELPWKGEGSLAKDTLVRIHRDLGSDFLVLGSYTVLGEKGKQQLRLDLRLQDARSGEIVAEVGETGTEADLFDLLSRAGSQSAREAQCSRRFSGGCGHRAGIAAFQSHGGSFLFGRAGQTSPARCFGGPRPPGKSDSRRSPASPPPFRSGASAVHSRVRRKSRQRSQERI